MADKRMEWFRDAKYGVIIHWGLYSLLAGEWNGGDYSSAAEWIMRNARIPLAEYRKLVDQFDPTEFNADEWVDRAVKYGAKYLCFTTKHHDGFAMFDSKVSDYNIMHTPFGRDVVKELSEACAKRGIVFCLYYSQMQDWEDPNADGNTWDFDPEKKDFKVYFEQKVKPQVRELLTNYGKIGMMWFDTPYQMPIELCRELRELVLSIQPDCIINGRIGYGLGDYRQMGDNDIPVLGYRGDWETPMTLNETWGYAANAKRWKDPKTVMNLLIDVAGKGGNLLLNIGPDGTGRIPDEGDHIMQTMGEWLRTNGESIYGTRRTVDFPYQIRWGGITTKGNTLYFHILHTDEITHQVRICNMESKVKRVYLLETGEELTFFQTYELARDEHRFRIITEGKVNDPLDTVIVVELEDEPKAHSLYMDFERLLAKK